MKTIVSLTLIVLGAMLLAMPLFLSFLLHAFSSRTLLSDGVFSEGQQVACWIPGGFMLLIGIVSAFFCRSADGKPPKLPV
jgi:hypothetical protein